MYGQSAWLNQLNSAFTVPGGPAAGVINVHMWDTVTTETPSAGTFLAQGMANTATALTLTHTFATQLFTVSTSGSMEADASALDSWGTKAASALVAALQNVVIAALKAGSITTNAKTLSTTFIDYAIPASTTTTAAMVLEYLQPLYKLIANVEASKTDEPNTGNFWIAMPPDAWGNLQGMCSNYDNRITYGFTGPNGIFQRALDGVPVYVIKGATSFGGAGNEVTFIGSREMFACKHSGVRPWRGGTIYEDGDGQLRRSFYIAYATGLVKEALGAEIVNPKS